MEFKTHFDLEKRHSLTLRPFPLIKSKLDGDGGGQEFSVDEHQHCPVPLAGLFAHGKSLNVVPFGVQDTL